MNIETKCIHSGSEMDSISKGLNTPIFPSTAHEYLDVVDESDNVVGKASFPEIYEKKLMHRIVHVLVFDKKGRRRFCKENSVS